MKHIHFKEINSTNTYLKENYSNYENLTIVSAEHQTNGKGRFNRKWIDNDDLLFSILIKENLVKITDYSLLIAKSIFNVLSKYMDNLSIKWPNDIMVNDNKICGILLEAVSTSKIECVVLGVGINVNTTIFSEDLLLKATSMKNILNRNINKEELLAEIMICFEKDYNEYINGNKDFISVINNNFYLKDKEVSFNYNNVIYSGKALGINEYGEILIKVEDEIMNIYAGEVTFTNTYKK